MVYAFLAVALSLFLVFYCGPRWGTSNMLVYICICSLIGSLSVVFTQGIGGAIVHSFTIKNQFTNWFVYVVLALTLVTLAIEIIYLNKALNIFNTAVVTPTYYVIFTTLTIVSSIVFYRGFDASPTDVVTCVFGFLIICSGVALLQQSRSEKPKMDPLADDTHETLLPLFESEKYMTSEDDLHHIENAASSSSNDSRNNRDLWRRSRQSMDDYKNSHYPEEISLNTITSNRRDSGKNSLGVRVCGMDYLCTYFYIVDALVEESSNNRNNNRHDSRRNKQDLHDWDVEF